MLMIAAVLFAIAALGGAYLAVRFFTGNPPPVPLAFVHGGAAAAALVVLILGLGEAGSPTILLAAVALFVVAALGGAAMLVFFHLRMRLPPRPLILLHGILAVAGFAALLVHLAG
jgi:hypothetical protein